VYVDEGVLRYAVSLVTATREAPEVSLGASPRASVWLVRVAQARALAEERDFVLPDDVKTSAVGVLAHRMIGRQLRGGVEAMREVVRRLTDEVPVPLHSARKG
jgi:MoxR-like ATPase